MSPARSSRITVLRDVEIPLRDGTRSVAEVWVPDDATPKPTILMRTPYLKEVRAPIAIFDPRTAAARGYASVIQDCRGRGGSKGSFDPYRNEELDGFDTIQWVASQDWSDGRVVMGGTSYEGASQWLAAVAAPPALCGISPALSSDDFGEGWSYRNGVAEFGFLTSWSGAELAPLPKRMLDDPSLAWRDPQAAIDVAPWLREWLANEAGSEFWSSRSVASRRSEVNVPALVIGGWFDIFLDGTLGSYSRSTHPLDRLVIGPWGHDDGTLSHLIGEASVGIAGFGLRTVFRWILDYYDAILSGQLPKLPKVRAYALGGRRWVDLESWPPTDAATERLQISTGSFVVDPGNPVTVVGGRGLLMHVPGRGFGIADQRRLLDCDDVHLALRTTLAADTLLGGPIRADLRVAMQSSGDQWRLWVALLCVVQPNGALYNLVEGVARGGPDDERVRLELGHTFTWLPAGSELVLFVMGSWFPRWPMPTSGGTQRILDGSYLDLTVVPPALLGDGRRQSGFP